jgi:hypothetical protein
VRERKSVGYVYLFRSESTHWFKIGFSTEPARRLKQLNSEMPELQWILVASIETNDCRRLEAAFHNLFSSQRITRGKEWFRLTEVEVEFFKAMSETTPKFSRFLSQQPRGIIRGPREVLDMARKLFGREQP